MPATQARTAQRKSKPTVRGKGSSAGARQLGTPEHAYHELRRRILDNDLAPGASYSERQLEQAIGLNSATVRGALRRLAEESLVELHSRHGVRIVPISLDDLREIFEIMIALEPMAARRVALQDVTKADLDRLTATIRQMDAPSSRTTSSPGPGPTSFSMPA